MECSHEMIHESIEFIIISSLEFPLIARNDFYRGNKKRFTVDGDNYSMQ